MKAIETKAQVDEARMLTITMQVPVDVQAGEYKAMVVLSLAEEPSPEVCEPAVNEQKSDEDASRAERWQKWFEAVDQLPVMVDKQDKTFHQILVEKYRKQGLDL